MINKLALSILLFGFFLAACGPAPPDLVLTTAYADLGEVPNGEIRQIEVEIQNIGGSTLRIEQISTSCGCTTANIDPPTISSGATGILIVTFDSGAHGSDFIGRVVREVFMTTNDPDEREVTFRFSADIVAADP